MNTKEAIEFVEWLKRQTLNTICYDEEPAKKITENFYNKLEKLTELLKRGESDDIWNEAKESVKGMYEAQIKHLQKFEKIVRDVKTVLLSGYFIDHAPELERFRRLFKDIEQKYFPK